MPKNKSAAIRYRIIDQCINDKRHRYPSLEYLAEKCSNLLNTDVSCSTIEKDIAAMKKDHPIGHNAPIVYSKQHKGYAYSEVGFSIAELNLQDEEWNALRFTAQLLHQYKDVPIFTDFKSAIERINTRFSLGIDAEEKLINQFVHFEKANASNGQEWINLIYSAIKNKHALSFTYNNIYKKKTSSYQLIPYLLKEHRNRWYVIGWEEEREDYITFALDRISKLKTVSVTSQKRRDFQAETFFQHATGIMKGASSKPVQVELTIKEPISKLVLLEPIHNSQKVLKENADSINISMNVLVNEEFCLRILSMGPWCIVSKPASLSKIITDMITKMSKNYKIRS